MRITVNTPSGNIGRPLTQALLDAGAQVTIISRNPDKVADLVGRGARLVKGEIDDERVLDEALAGADAVFWLNPPAFRPDFVEWCEATGQKAAAAAKRHGASRAVVLSSLGAQAGRVTGAVAPLLAIEKAFEAALPNSLALRPGFFMENILRNVGTIAGQGAIYAPVPGDVPVPQVATRDIAAVAAQELLDGAWTGHRVRGVHGPRDVSQNEAAEILSKVLGRPVKYVQVTVEQAGQGMLAAGFPDFVAKLFTDMYSAILSGKMVPAEPRSAETTTPTTLEQFARDVVAPAVAQAQAR
ncbi:MAG TPA: NmrA family NAD(P)-binding protein [Haliangium sp.]|nr:NmrA family NAD(P)-binding protein [Haliangium sp.]